MPSPSPESRDRRLTRRAGAALGVLAGVVLGVVAWVVVERLDGADGPEPPVLVGDILANPRRYDDRPVRVSDQVQSVRDRFFTLGGETAPERLLVYQPPRSQEVITPNDAVDVIGRVRRFDPAAFARRYDRSFAPYADWASRLVLVPERIDPSVPDDGTAPA